MPKKYFVRKHIQFIFYFAALYPGGKGSTKVLFSNLGISWNTNFGEIPPN